MVWCRMVPCPAPFHGVFRLLHSEVNQSMTVKKHIARTDILPMLALRGLVVFPGMMLHFDVGRKKSILALNESMSAEQTILLVTQTDIANDEIGRAHV